MTRIGRERGWGPTTRAQFEASCQADGHLLVGSPEQVAEKIIKLHGLFQNDRFLLQMALGSVAHADIMRAIELFGTKVAPLVRKEIGNKS
jgi:alkanesulfonate monooxygenase SsuD/methylene tetrahydromethanopterin reductase-like flavin-dependent oxidoreductase (luciferase family)